MLIPQCPQNLCWSISSALVLSENIGGALVIIQSEADVLYVMYALKKI